MNAHCMWSGLLCSVSCVCVWCTQASLGRWTMCIRAGICSNYALCDDAMDIDDVAVQYYVLFAYLVVVY